MSLNIMKYKKMGSWEYFTLYMNNRFNNKSNSKDLLCDNPNEDLINYNNTFNFGKKNSDKIDK